MNGFRNMQKQLSHYEITCLAIKNGELEKLLLGEEPYICMDRWSQSPGPTDITYVYRALCEYAQKHPHDDLRHQITMLLPRLCTTTIGIDAASGILLCESLNQMRHGSAHPPLDLDIEEAADIIKMAVRKYQQELREDHSGVGKHHREGLLEALRRGSRYLEEDGGPTFVDI